jgi:hypothetical protein
MKCACDVSPRSVVQTTDDAVDHRRRPNAVPPGISAQHLVPTGFPNRHIHRRVKPGKNNLPYKTYATIQNWFCSSYQDYSEAHEITPRAAGTRRSSHELPRRHHRRTCKSCHRHCRRSNCRRTVWFCRASPVRTWRKVTTNFIAALQSSQQPYETIWSWHSTGPQHHHPRTYSNQWAQILSLVLRIAVLCQFEMPEPIEGHNCERSQSHTMNGSNKKTNQLIDFMDSGNKQY